MARTQSKSASESMPTPEDRTLIPLKGDPDKIRARFQEVQGAIEQLWASTLGTTDTRGARRLLVTSPGENEGTTTAACCTAIGLSRHLCSSVLLLETNFERPAAARYFESDETPGLAEVLRGDTNVASAIHETDQPYLYVMPAGQHKGAMTGSFAHPVAREMFEYLKRRFVHIVIDAPSLLEWPEARLLLSQVDKAIVVLRARYTEKRASKKLLEILRGAGVDVIGAVFNRFKPDAPSWLVPSKWE